MKVFKRILATLLLLPLSVLFAVIAAPFAALATIVALPWSVTEAIWQREGELGNG